MDFWTVIGLILIGIVLYTAYMKGYFDRWMYGAEKLWIKEAEPGEGGKIQFRMGGEITEGIPEKIQIEGDKLRIKLEDYEDELFIPINYFTVNKVAAATRNLFEPILITDYDILTGKPGPIALNAESNNAFLLDVANSNIEALKAENQILRTASDEQVRKWIGLNREWKKSLNIPLGGAYGSKYGKSYGGSYDEEGD